MRDRTLASVLLSLLAPACAGEIVQRPPPPPVDWRSLEHPRPGPATGPATATVKERAAAAAYLKALSSPGFTALVPLLDEEAHFRSDGAADVHGRDAVIKAHQDLLGGYRDRRFTLGRVLLTESDQALEWTMGGTSAASGKPITLRGLALLWTRDDGSISDIHLYFAEAPPDLSGSAPELAEQRHSEEEAGHVTLVRAALHALKEDNEAGYLATLAPDVEVYSPKSAALARGIAAARAWFRGLRNAIAYLSPSVENAWGIGPYVVLEYRIVGEQRRPLAKAPAQQGRLVEFSAVDIAEIRDGKIARVWRYGDLM